MAARLNKLKRYKNYGFDIRSHVKDVAVIFSFQMKWENWEFFFVTIILLDSISRWVLLSDIW